jgi:hypothetical protein
MNLREFFQDNEGNFSFKRLQTGLYLFLFIFLFFINLFTGKSVSDPILELLVVMNLYSYTGVVVESFQKRGAKTMITRDKIIKEEDVAGQGTSTEVPVLPPKE